MIQSLLEQGRNLIDRASGASFRSFSLRTQRVLLVLALAVFLVGGTFAVGRLDVELENVRWPYIAVAGLIGVPITAILNALEFSLSVRIVGARTRFMHALRISVLSTAANLLPAPGGPIIRIQALRHLGAGNRGAISSTGVLGLLWLGLAAVTGGGILVTTRQTTVAWVFLAVGVVATILSIALLASIRIVKHHGSMLVAAAAIEGGMVLVSALRILLILEGLGVPASISDALVIAVSGVVASVVGVFPGGLGLRETLGAGLAPLVGLAPSIGFAVTAGDRIIGIAIFAPLTIWLILRQRGTGLSPDVELSNNVHPEIHDDH